MHMHNVQRKHGLLSPTSLCSCLRINTSIFFFFFLLIKPTNEGAQSGNLCILKHVHTSVHAGGELGVRVQFTAAPLRAVDHRFVFPFRSVQESNGARHERGNLEAALFLSYARVCVCVHEGPSPALHTVHLAFLCPRHPRPRGQ